MNINERIHAAIKACNDLPEVELIGIIEQGGLKPVLTQMALRIDSLEKDKARLDWMDADDNALDVIQEIEQCGPAVSLRAAIDALMNKSK